jgi:hypothetical protein
LTEERPVITPGSSTYIAPPTTTCPWFTESAKYPPPSNSRLTAII